MEESLHTELFVGFWFNLYLKGETYAHCSICGSDFSVAHGGKNVIIAQIEGAIHKQYLTASTSSSSLTLFFAPQTSNVQTETETRWSLFIAKHNLAFLTSDHANNIMLLPKMFSDSAIAKRQQQSSNKLFHHTISRKCSPIWKILFHWWWMNPTIKLTNLASQSKEEYVLDMPVVNIGNAQNLFQATRNLTC